MGPEILHWGGKRNKNDKENPNDDSEINVQIWGCDPSERRFYSAKYSRSWLDQQEREVLKVSRPHEPCRPFLLLIPARDILVMDVATTSGIIADDDKAVI